jgi:hypothetical protein
MTLIGGRTIIVATFVLYRLTGNNGGKNEVHVMDGSTKHQDDASIGKVKL